MRRRKPLVCQHIENLSRRALEKYEDVVRDFVRNRRGVYALYRRGELYYVGLAGNLRNRLKSHLKGRHATRWDRFSVYLTISDSHLKELESLVLRFGRPRGNKQIGKFARSENLMPKLRRAFRRRWAEEEREMTGRGAAVAERSRRKERIKGRSLAGHFDRAITLRARCNGIEVRARLRRNGTIRFAGRIYASPSRAASVARGGPTNGWWFWQYERAPGEWARLRELRR